MYSFVEKNTQMKSDFSNIFVKKGWLISKKAKAKVKIGRGFGYVCVCVWLTFIIFLFLKISSR